MSSFHRNTDDITKDVLEGAKAIILAGPRKRFELEEINVLKQFMNDGGGKNYLRSCILVHV